MLVIIGADEYGEKDILTIMDGFRENAESWRDLLNGLKARGLAPPELAVGNGSLGFRAALQDVHPDTKEQRCRFHKAANVTGAMPKSLMTGPDPVCGTSGRPRPGRRPRRHLISSRRPVASNTRTPSGSWSRTGMSS